MARRKKSRRESFQSEILISYSKSRKDYERLASEIRRLFDIDPGFPDNSIYTVKHRLKQEERLVEKLESLRRSGKHPKITAKNFPNFANDLLGMRIVCLRRSDVEKVGRYLESLQQEEKLRFVKKPIRKQPPFLWIQNPTDKLKFGDLQYTGYSSIHYLVRLGKKLKPPKDLSDLRCEIQVRTILEEAWGEIDHKYRYELTRTGTQIPEAVDRGFRSFSAYLQAAAVQSEYLCKDVEALLKPPAKKRRMKRRASPTGTATVASAPAPAVHEHHNTIEQVLHKKFGFPPTSRMIAYAERRMHDNGVYSGVADTLEHRYLTKDAVETFTKVYEDVLAKEPFKDLSERDIDVLNALNFCIFRTIQPESVAIEDLRSILHKRRFPRFRP